MLEAITGAITRELNHAVDGVVKTIQRRMLRILIKAFLIIAGIAAVMLGIIIMGAQYVGLDLMLLLSGMVFIVAFFLV